MGDVARLNGANVMGVTSGNLLHFATVRKAGKEFVAIAVGNIQRCASPLAVINRSTRELAAADDRERRGICFGEGTRGDYGRTLHFGRVLVRGWHPGPMALE